MFNRCLNSNKKVIAKHKGRAEMLKKYTPNNGKSKAAVMAAKDE